MSRLAVAILCCPMACPGCGAEDRSTKSNDQSTASEAAGDGLGVDFPHSDEPVDLNPADFTADVTNPWFPLEPGTGRTYRESTEDGEVVV